MLHSFILTVLLMPCVVISQSNKKYFYIYDWPMPLRDVYPPPGAILHPTASYDHEFYENDGFGKTLDRQQGLFATWQFSLFKNLMARLRVSEHRTLDSTKASIFIIPYDMGVHSFIGEGELQLLFLSFVFVCIMLLSYIPVYIYTLHSSMQVCILSIFSLPCFTRS
jgi:hypothetical protein